MMKTPDECENMVDIRAEIDRLDRQVIALLSGRFAYVKAASKFKRSETTVKAPERFNAMLGQRRVWAEEDGLNADVIENGKCRSSSSTPAGIGSTAQSVPPSRLPNSEQLILAVGV
jgi:isochorismate pyruvate lyase